MCILSQIGINNFCINNVVVFTFDYDTLYKGQNQEILTPITLDNLKKLSQKDY